MGRRFRVVQQFERIEQFQPLIIQQQFVLVVEQQQFIVAAQFLRQWR